LTPEEVDSLLLDAMLGDTPIDVLGETLVAKTRWVSLVGGLIETRGVKDGDAFHVRKVRHEGFVLDFEEAVLEG
jgi:hypothetical protein